jgi:hypothetical protein|tara:strand:- start:296 stop:553 length:258 start_codon:yes stop_codon:yes gene_type:complete
MDKNINFVQGIYAKQYKEWLTRVSFHIPTMKKNIEKWEKEMNEKGYKEIEMLLSKKGALYFKEKDIIKQEITSQDHNPDRNDLPF